MRLVLDDSLVGEQHNRYERMSIGIARLDFENLAFCSRVQLYARGAQSRPAPETKQRW